MIKFTWILLLELILGLIIIYWMIKSKKRTIIGISLIIIYLIIKIFFYR